jgi:hydroxyacylglutathione hydrolase
VAVRDAVPSSRRVPADPGAKGAARVSLTISPILIGGKFSVNCYLLRTDTGFVMVDSGMASGRDTVRDALAEAGCSAGDLKLVVITHGDADHIGNAAWLRDEYRAPIAMSAPDAPMAVTGNMFASRRGASPIVRTLVKVLGLFGVGLPRDARFTPDLAFGEGDSLKEFGLDAKVLSLPGHSPGSLGILTAGRDFFSGDMLANGSSGPTPSRNRPSRSPCPSGAGSSSR